MVKIQDRQWCERTVRQGRCVQQHTPGNRAWTIINDDGQFMREREEKES